MLVEEFDTVTRENFADALARWVLGSGQRWPRYRDKASSEKFHDDFERAAGRKGIRVV